MLVEFMLSILGILEQGIVLIFFKEEANLILQMCSIVI